MTPRGPPVKHSQRGRTTPVCVGGLRGRHSPPPHLHRAHEEGFYVLDGTLEVTAWLAVRSSPGPASRSAERPRAGDLSRPFGRSTNRTISSRHTGPWQRKQRNWRKHPLARRPAPPISRKTPYSGEPLIGHTHVPDTWPQ